MKRLLLSILTTTVSFSAIAADYTRLTPGSQLLPGDRLLGATATLTMQHDGNLVLSSNSQGTAIWHSGTYGKGVTSFQYQSDGNLVLYKDTPAPAIAVWNSGTNTIPNPQKTELVVQDNVLHLRYTDLMPIWRAPTCTSSVYPVCAGYYPNNYNSLVAACSYDEAQRIAWSVGWRLGSCSPF